jgi:aspartyl protease family protein
VGRPLTAVCAALLLGGHAAYGQTVSLGGTFGDKALLVIDGAPRTLAVGAQAHDVRLLSVQGGGAIVEVKGRRVALTLGGAQVNLGGSAPAESRTGQIVLTADSAGHFFTNGTINGKTVRFLVDTGATNIGIGQAEADRRGIDYRAGRRGFSGTANGAVPVYMVPIGSVRIGDVQLYNVEATVLPATMTHVLLGNSFLTRFQMKRENDKLTLERRF